MSEDEIKRYKQLGKKTYKIIIGNTEDVGIGGEVNSAVFKPDGWSKSKIRRAGEWYFEDYKSWLNVKKDNLTYGVGDRFCGRSFETNQIDELVRYLKSLLKKNIVDHCIRPYVKYYKKSSKRLLYFRSQKTVQLIIDLMYRSKKGLLAYKISNGIKTIKGEDLTITVPSASYLSTSYRPKLIFTKLNPILKNHLNQPNHSVSLFESRDSFFKNDNMSGYKSNDYPWGFRSFYHNLANLNYKKNSGLNLGKFSGVTNSGGIVCDPEKTSKQYAFLWEYVDNPEYDNISSAVISLSDFNFTSNTIFSMSLNDILSLSELEKVESYQIYPTHEVSDKSISNSSASKTFKIKIQKNRTNINIRKKPVNGVLVGQVSGGELYTVTNELLTDTPIYLLNNYMVLTDFQTDEKIEKPKDFKLNSVRENTKNTYYAELINTNNTINKVYIEKNKVKIEYNRWYYLLEMKGWIYSVFCEKI
jgi:hypothetical protein